MTALKKTRRKEGGPGIPLREVARRQLPEIKEWIRSVWQIGWTLTRQNILEKAPGMENRAWSTRRVMSYCICSELVREKVLIKIGPDLYRVQFAL